MIFRWKLLSCIKLFPFAVTVKREKDWIYLEQGIGELHLRHCVCLTCLKGVVEQI